LNSALAQLDRAAEIDNKLEPAKQALQAALEAVEVEARNLRRYRESLDCDAESLSQLEERLAVLAQIKRKYGPNLSDAISLSANLAEEIEKLENSQSRKDEIAGELSALESELRGYAKELSIKRKQQAAKLTKDLVALLSELGMPHCRIEIAFLEDEQGNAEVNETGAKQPSVGASGMDHVEFRIAANPGVPFGPIAKIASGGELSRVMLAIKSILSKADQVSTVIFDEIDTGLSGKALQAMRDKLASLAKSHQILCITHQPMIAACADSHIQVAKEQSKDKTTISCQTLSEPERLKAVAAMASGDSDQKAALQFAKSLFAGRAGEVSK